MLAREFKHTQRCTQCQAALVETRITPDLLRLASVVQVRHSRVGEVTVHAEMMVTDELQGPELWAMVLDEVMMSMLRKTQCRRPFASWASAHTHTSLPTSAISPHTHGVA